MVRPHGDVIDDWLERRAARQAAEHTTTTTYDRCGMYRNPRAGVETVVEAVARGMRCALLCLDQAPDDWRVVRERLDRHQVPYGYWLRCLSVPDLDRLLAASKGRPLVGINVEGSDIVGRLRPEVLAARVQASWFGGVPALVTDGWVYGTANLTPIADWPTLLEIMPQDNPDLWPPTIKTAHCLQHARDLGAKHPIPLWGAQDMSERSASRIRDLGFRTVTARSKADPSWYPLDQHPNAGIYCIDDVEPAGTWSQWGWQ